MNRNTLILLLVLTTLSPWSNAAEAVFGPVRDIVGTHSGVVIGFPDVAHTPAPGHQAPGVPIPYPNISRLSDTGRGDGAAPAVRRSEYARDQNECETPPRVLRSGGAYFELPSLDVEIEQPRAVRYLDMTTHNHR